MRTHLGALRSGFALVTALSVSAFVTDARAYTAEDQQACMGDAFRLCGSDIPNVERITACMIRQKAQLSPRCRAHFRPPESAVRPVATRSLRSPVRKPGHTWLHRKRKTHHSR